MSNVGQFVKKIFGKTLDRCLKLSISFKPEESGKLEGTEMSQNKWICTSVREILPEVYIEMSNNGFSNPPKEITKYFFSKDGDESFWNQKPYHHEIMVSILRENLINEQMIYNYRNNIFPGKTKECIKKDLFNRGILKRKVS